MYRCISPNACSHELIDLSEKKKMPKRAYASLQRIIRLWRGRRPDGRMGNCPYQRVIEDSENGLRVPKRLGFRFAPRPRYRLKIRGLGRFLKGRSRLVAALRISCSRFYKRMKESQVHFADLFAGNYLLLQVTPPPIFYKYERPALKVIPGSTYGFYHDPMCH